MKLTKEMINWFYQRTEKHINLVRKYADKIYQYNRIKFYLLPVRMTKHDQSKFEEPELTPYVFLTWNYYCKDNNIDFKLPDDIKEKMHEATYHHVKSNKHHPEYHDDTTTIESINPKDRDKPPEKMVDGTKMSNIDIAEMVADWMAMSEERGGHPKDWADMNVNKRWKFTNEQKNLIYELIENIW